MARSSLGFMPLALWLWALPGQAQRALDDVAGTAPPAPDALEAELAREVQLSQVERAVLSRHPALQESAARAAALSARAAGADRLPDLELKYEQWAVPLSRPYALNRADTLMFGLRQSFPAPGVRAARARAASADREQAAQQQQGVARELRLRVRRAYFDYYAADRALRVQREHLAVAEQIAGQVRAGYELGRGAQQDALKVLVEVARLQNELAELRQQRESSRLQLNALMARAPDAALGPPAEPAPAPARVEPAALEGSRAGARPELAAARQAIERSQAALDEARHAARRPGFMVGVDYWLMPTLDSPHAYGAMVAMSLPWLSAGRRADVREAEQLLSAERHAARVLDWATQFELHDALARLEAARASLEIIEGSVLPQADKSLEAAKAAFALGSGSLLSLLEALRAYFQVRLEHSQARSRVLAQLASVEFAAGVDLIAEAGHAQ